MATGEEINQLLTELDNKSVILVTRFMRLIELVKRMAVANDPFSDEMSEAVQELVLADTDYAVATLDAIQVLIKSQSTT